MTAWIDRVVLIGAVFTLAAAATGRLSYADRSADGEPPWRFWPKGWLAMAVIFGVDVARADLTAVERWGRGLFSAAVAVGFAWDYGRWWSRRPAPTGDDMGETLPGQGDLQDTDNLSSDG